MSARKWTSSLLLLVVGLVVTPAVPASAQTGAGIVAGVVEYTSDSTYVLDLEGAGTIEAEGQSYTGPMRLRGVGIGSPNGGTGPITVSVTGSVGPYSVNGTCTGSVTYTPPTWTASLHCLITITTPFGSVTVTVCITVTAFATLSITFPPPSLIITGGMAIFGC